MRLREQDTVVILRDLPEHDQRRGDFGVLVTVLSAARFTVEFVRVSGGTRALVDLDATDIRTMAGSDLPAVHGAGPES